MTPEAADFLAKAVRTIARAERVLHAGEPVDAARDAYIAALSAARAIVFEKTGKSPKTHNGSRALFLLLISQGLSVPRDVAQFLEDGFALKTRADYGVDDAISVATATEAVALGQAFVRAVSELLEQTKA